MPWLTAFGHLIRKDTAMTAMQPNETPVQIENNVLLCPVCRSNNLHQSQIETYYPERPDSFLGETQVIKITFQCEQCHLCVDSKITQPYYLEIRQHKGLTQLEWLLP